MESKQLGKLRGDLIIKKQENFGVFQKWEGGGVKKQQNCLKFKFGHLKTHGGDSIFQNCLNHKLLSDPILKKKN